MGRLYLFAIGGTGARVLKGLSHLLAAGMPILDEHGRPMDLVPLVIDPDAENGDTLECLGTLADYTAVRSQLIDGPAADYSCGFFRTRMLSYQQLRAEAVAVVGDHPPARTGAENVFRSGFIDPARTKTFGEAIGYDFLESDYERGGPTRLLVDALYSSQNINTNLSGGFLGNPNVGTVVLSKFSHSVELEMLAGLLHADDRIFVISSIFGGTGAAGFPVLVKQLRQARNARGHQTAVLRDATIGALTVLPYFGLDDGRDSPVDASAFIPKTKAALAYYAHHLGRVDALYYIGDRARKRYANRPTGNGQRNPEHLIELIGATAVLHFAAQPKASLATPAFHECGVRIEPSKPVTLPALGALGQEIERPATQFAMVRLFLQGFASLGEAPLLLKQPWAQEGRFDKSFFTVQSAAFGPLVAYIERWWSSFVHMASNDAALQVFGDTFDTLRRDISANGRVDSNQINLKLNVLDRRRCGPPRSLHRLMTLLWNGTDALYRKRYESRAPGV